LIEQNLHIQDNNDRCPCKKKEKALTICIASICEANTGSPRIVFCSDRLVTDSNGLTFEQGKAKVDMLLPNCLIMNAGDASRGGAIIRDAFLELASMQSEKKEKINIKEIAELVKKHYDIHRNQAIEQQIFESRGMDRKTFYTNMKSIYDWLALMIDNRVQSYNFDVAFIILGIDIIQETKWSAAHLYQISCNQLQYLSPMGFSMVGIGSYQSLPELTKEPYNPSMPLSECLVRTFWAKKLSERMVSVGKDTTDLGILYVEPDQTTQRIISKNTLLADNFKQELLARAFEQQKEVIKQLTDKVQKNINNAFQGKPIETTNPSAST